MSESQLWTTVRKNYYGIYGRIIRVEDKLSKGTPDTSYALRKMNRTVEGWLELKYLENWPVRSETPICVPSLTLDQVLWHEEHAKYNAHSYLLLQVKNSYILLLPEQVRKLYEKSFTKYSLIYEAKVYAERTFPTKEILEVLTSDRNK